MRFHFVFLLLLVTTGCDDATTDASLGTRDGAEEGDGSFEPDGAQPHHPWYVGEGPGGPVIQIPIARPGIGGLFVHTREMSNAEAISLGADLPESNDLPTAVTYVQAAAIANAASIRDGLEPCYAIPVSDRPSLRPCDGWRVMSKAEFIMLLDDQPPTDGYPLAMQRPTPLCAEPLEDLNLCYRCTCPDGPMPVGFSTPNRFGLQDLLGNRAEIIDEEPFYVGGDHASGWNVFRDLLRSGLTQTSEVGAVRLVSLVPID